MSVYIKIMLKTQHAVRGLILAAECAANCKIHFGRDHERKASSVTSVKVFFHFSFSLVVFFFTCTVVAEPNTNDSNRNRMNERVQMNDTKNKTQYRQNEMFASQIN